jgi:hypothetical protein
VDDGLQGVLTGHGEDHHVFGGGQADVQRIGSMVGRVADKLAQLFFLGPELRFTLGHRAPGCRLHDADFLAQAGAGDAQVLR